MKFADVYLILPCDCCNSKHELIRNIALHGLNNAGFSLIGSNFIFVSRRFGFKNLCKRTARTLFSSRVTHYAVDDETRARANLLRETILLRDGLLEITPTLSSVRFSGHFEFYLH